MFTIYHSNQLDLLKDLLVDLIGRNPLPNPLTEEQILVQSPGMAQWLRQEIASANGIAASINFPLPASFLWDAFVRILPDVPKRSAFNKEAMTWKLVTLLPELIHRDAFAPLKRYLENDDDGVRSYQLAGKIADIFDQYLVYRPEWIADWEQGKNSFAEEQLWQPELWRALVTKTSESGQSHWHRANMHHSFLSALSKGQHQDRLPKRLFVFGISAMPPHFIETLKALGEQTDVHLMVCNPCQYYWGDEKDPKYLARLAARLFAKQTSDTASSSQADLFSQTDYTAQGNSLLASMGKLGRDYVHQLYDLDAQEIFAFVDGCEDSLLHSVQKDILELADHSQDKPSLTFPVDQSLVFHSCHSPLREVEVLHDQLLALFERNPELSPRDVVVMLPDVDQYSPWINAVFGGLSNHYDDPRYIPYSISDRSASHEHPVLPGILQLLNLDKSRCSAAELLELLEIPAIKRRFGFTEEGYEKIRHWIDEAGIRWGLNPEHQQGFDIPPRDQNSWQFGVKRMLLGYAMPEENGLFNDILPLDLSQGMDAVLSGQLATFIDQAERFVRLIDNGRSIAEWALFINELVEAFVEPDEEDEYALKLVRDALENLSNQLNDAGYAEHLSRPVMLDYLTERLNSERSCQKFLVGKVNFCTLMPMRSIPFKVVCLLGMNDGAYPRSIPPTGFDLMTEHPRRGDRSRREDDRYLFLEAMLSARETLYISYVGSSIKDNSERIPSVLVSELLDYCSHYFSQPEDVQQLITEHRLQPFSQANFDDTGHLFSYASEWLPVASGETIAQQDFLQTSLVPMELPDEIELPELIRFFRNPAQYFCNRRLRVYFDAIEERLEETEPFDLNPLETYLIRQDLTDVILTDRNMDNYTDELQATGKLPHGVFGELFLTEQQENVLPLTENIRWATTNPTDDIEVNLKLTEVSLTGWLRQHFSVGLVRYRPAKLKAKDLISAWIEHLCCCSQGYSHSTHLFSLDKAATFSVVDTSEAKQLLEVMCSLYLNGHNQPLPFFPQTAHQWYDTLNEKNDREKADAAAATSFYGGFNFSGENNNEYIQRLFPELEPVFPQLQSLAEQIFSPLSGHLALEKRGDK